MLGLGRVEQLMSLLPPFCWLLFKESAGRRQFSADLAAVSRAETGQSVAAVHTFAIVDNFHSFQFVPISFVVVDCKDFVVVSVHWCYRVDRAVYRMKYP